MVSPDDGGGSTRGNVLGGLVTAGLGLVLMLTAVGIIPSSPARDGTPLWIGGLAGLAFVLAGAAIASARSSAIRGGPATSPLLGGAIFLILVAIANWVAFGPGERHFSGGIGLGLIGVGGRVSEWTGRAAFDIGAVIMDLLVVLFVARGIRRLLGADAGNPAR